jgi:hypothetical protein
MERIFSAAAIIGSLGAAIVIGTLATITGNKFDKDERRDRSGEAFVASLLGAFIAHAFIVAMLELGDNSKTTGVLVGWGFFGVHGFVDTILAIAGKGPVLNTPGVLLTTAVVVGAVHGGLHGAARSYRWLGLGPLQFAADVTWGLLGSTTGALLHLWNCIVGQRATTTGAGIVDERRGAAVFCTGFHPPRSSAFTQGAVISNFGTSASEPLLRHELTHVLQNRLFGPFYTLSYLLWLAVMFVPSLIAHAMKSDDSSRIMAWCYFSNPWEVWAYAVHSGHTAEAADIRKQHSPSSWHAASVIFVVIAFLFVGTSVTAVLTLT